ncbi:1-pyrroline-5-carboxylate dehydrogenase [Photobacterium sp. DNB23_23_1]|uniref:1-pyrroline-5-carboxylate dehydrogenase n=1 Tax=Photobacterium pectinilyticum TaxID=2906793 RepID=A0ABT1N3N1_9GAMM|nr:1-pyrroline-5-carboxylate dehydrogenase [Photobacterium sp. ZSDE20]MCQ1059329.1 1-pyrroline-5-carboxylate dehydrogenase [Photobacterium sp. ZSDE20]MDD1825588.1 1-pyrroline-5-carboxylate dehydrogenase [Photobacterium sp. ZSDE20]
MTSILDRYNDSFTAFESWNLTDFSDKKQALHQLGNQLPAALANVFQYQFNHAEAVVAEPQSLTSPTGETNELYTQGRGVSIVLVDSGAPNCSRALVAMLAALLSAGNSAIICTNDNEIEALFEPFKSQHQSIANLVQFVPKEQYAALLKFDIRNFVYIGDQAKTVELSTELATRSNAITAMVAETDLENLPLSKDPMLVLRFITEKVRTINVTAVGGNAMLLELGSSAH